MNENLNVGDVVVLKSGGPPMTIVGQATTPTMVICSWFAGEEVKTSSFSLVSLKKTSA